MILDKNLHDTYAMQSVVSLYEMRQSIHKQKEEARRIYKLQKKCQRAAVNHFKISQPKTKNWYELSLSYLNLWGSTLRGWHSGILLSRASAFGIGNLLNRLESLRMYSLWMNVTAEPCLSIWAKSNFTSSVRCLSILRTMLWNIVSLDRALMHRLTFLPTMLWSTVS